MSDLHIRGVSAGYNGKNVIQDISLEVSPGKIIALLGPNGSGKTTLIRSMCRILKPSEGAVTLDGTDIWRMPPKRFTRTVARVPQTAEITWPYTVEQIVSMGRYPHQHVFSTHTRSDRVSVEEAIEKTGLQVHRHSQLNRLSGGEFQRAIIARALAQNPRILILDEPVAHLDLKYKVAILDLLHSLSRSGHGIVVSLHDLNLAAMYADELTLLHEGRLFAQGGVDQVLRTEIIESAYETPVSIVPRPGGGPPWIEPVSRNS